MRDAVVVKIGGSLLDRSREIIDILDSERCNALIVPGGGIFADLARKFPVDDDVAHWMAILGMEQFGWYMAQTGIPTTDILAVPRETTILLPYRVLRERDPLPYTWDVTSDTISAWVASVLHLDLIILKRVDGIRSGGALLEKVDMPLPTDDVDPSFIPFVISNNVKVLLVNGTIDERIISALKGAPTLGTTIGF